MLIVKQCGEFVEESARNIVTAFTGRHPDVEAGNLIHGLLNMKTANLLSTELDFRSLVTCELQHKKGECNSKLSKCRKTTPQSRQHTVHKQNHATTRTAHCPQTKPRHNTYNTLSTNKTTPQHIQHTVHKQNHAKTHTTHCPQTKPRHNTYNTLSTNKIHFPSYCEKVFWKAEETWL
jgi:hypothetical protein